MSDLKLITVSKEIKTALNTPLPEYIRKEKPAGKGSLTYVSGQAVIDKLNATFGYAGWSWEIVERFVQQSEPKVTRIKWVGGKKVNLEQPEYEPQQPVAHVVGRLTVYFERPDGSIHAVSKTAPGAQCLVGGQSEQENIFKGAHTDALKKAATMFGIGLELYRDPNEAYFFSELTYENPWTDEELSKHKEELEYLKQFKADHALSDTDMDNYINTYSAGAYPTMDYIFPENITDFVNYLKTLAKKAKK